MHDSRGAELKKGDRVLIEAEIVQLSTGGDENYCCVDVKVITPDQPDKDKVMSPPQFSALSTRMLTKVGSALVLLFAIAGPCFAQDDPASVLSRLTLMEQNLNGLNAGMSRLKSDMADVKADVAAMKADLAAVKVTLTQQPTVKKIFQPAVLDVWGNTTRAAQWVTVSADTPDAPPATQVMVSQPMMMSGYSSGMMQSSGGGPIRRLFSRLGGGSCGAGGCK